MHSQQPTSLIYCFSCFETKEESGRKFCITNCQHIFCSICFSRDNICGICKQQCKALEVNDSLPRDIKQFLDPKTPVSLVQTAIKVIRFQHNLRLNVIKKHYGYREKYHSLKKKFIEVREYQNKFSKEIEKEKMYIEMLKKAYHTQNITPDLFRLGKTSDSVSIDSRMSISPKTNSGIYSPLARYSMTNQVPRRTSLDSGIDTTICNQRMNALGNALDMNEENNYQRIVNQKRDKNKGLLQNARNVLMLNTMRCINESSQITSQQNKRSQVTENLSSMKKMRI